MATTKVALITASSAGLGAQIARVFAPDFRVVCMQTYSYMSIHVSHTHLGLFKHLIFDAS